MAFSVTDFLQEFTDQLSGNINISDLLLIDASEHKWIQKCCFERRHEFG